MCAKRPKRWMALLCCGICLPGCMSGRWGPQPYHQVAPIEHVYENPLYLAQGQDSYYDVFRQVYDVANDYFDIAYSNIQAGRIEGKPKVTAGFWDAVMLDWHSKPELIESTLQTIRRRVEITIAPAECGGYFVDVKVYKELEDLPQPTHASAGGAVIRFDNPLERVPDVVDSPYLTKGWIPFGRDIPLEQLILKRLQLGR
jgi:hypothetical protein